MFREPKIPRRFQNSSINETRLPSSTTPSNKTSHSTENIVKSQEGANIENKDKTFRMAISKKEVSNVRGKLCSLDILEEHPNAQQPFAKRFIKVIRSLLDSYIEGRDFIFNEEVAWQYPEILRKVDLITTVAVRLIVQEEEIDETAATDYVMHVLRNRCT